MINTMYQYISKINRSQLYMRLLELKMNNLQTIFPKKTWKDEFFNYGITNEKQKDTIVSKTPYISFKAVLEIINNLKLMDRANLLKEHN